MGDFPLACSWKTMQDHLGMVSTHSKIGYGLWMLAVYHRTYTLLVILRLSEFYILKLIWDALDGRCRPCNRYPNFAKGAFGIWGKRISSVTSMFLAPAFACDSHWDRLELLVCYGLLLLPGEVAEVVGLIFMIVVFGCFGEVASTLGFDFTI